MKTEADRSENKTRRNSRFGFKLWAWYMAFTVGILLLLWLLEVFAMDYLYKPMVEGSINRDIQTIREVLRDAESDYMDYKVYLDEYNAKVDAYKQTDSYKSFVENLKSTIARNEDSDPTSGWGGMNSEERKETVEELLNTDPEYQEQLWNRIDTSTVVNLSKLNLDGARAVLMGCGSENNYALKREIHRLSESKEGNGYLIFITDSKGNILYSLNDYNSVFKITKGQYMEMVESEYINTSIKPGVTNKNNSDLLFFGSGGSYSAMRGAVSPGLVSQINKVLRVNKARAELERSKNEDGGGDYYLELTSANEEIDGSRYMTYGIVVHRGAFFRGVELDQNDVKSVFDSIFKSWYSDNEYISTHCSDATIENIVRANRFDLQTEDFMPDRIAETMASLEAERRENDKKELNEAFNTGSKEDVDIDDAMFFFVCVPATVPGTTKNIIILSLSTILGLALLINTIISVAISRKFEKPIKVMTAEAGRLSRGDFNPEFSQGFCRELDDLSGTLSETAVALERLENNRREVLANVSHDLRTPLTMIRGYAEMVRDFSWSEEESREQDLEVIIRESDRLKALVNEVLEYTALQESKERMNMQPFDISERVRTVVGQFVHISEQRGYIIGADITDGLWVVGDEMKLERVMYNFLDNAITHTDESKRITVTLSAADGKVCFSVRDYGKGIKKGEERVIWDRYHTTRNKDSVKSISGLGLSISKEILEAHEAEYGVKSEGGCTFWFALPESGKPDA